MGTTPIWLSWTDIHDCAGATTPFRSQRRVLMAIWPSVVDAPRL